jgi:DNA-binding helix-hairpin-helix protein with protein kinase domain
MIAELLKQIFGHFPLPSGSSTATVPQPHTRGTAPKNRPGTHRRTPSAPVTGTDWQKLSQPKTSRNAFTVYDPRQTPLRLTPADEIAHGGEGIIYRIPQSSSYLLKLCKPETIADRQKLAIFHQHLAAMSAIEECREAKNLAWPLMPVRDGQGRTIGFAMQKCAGRTFRALFAPVQVQRFFPGWNRIQVTQVALNFLDAIRMLARHQVLVNDFNPSNFLVDKTGTVRFIDCDSFQIPIPGRPPLMTRTFTPEFCAPELLLHPENFNRPRTPEQVRFSLAVVIYMILMSGLHPFARCGGGDPAENLKSGKCPLVKESGVRMPVSWYKSVSWLTPSLKDCFIRMFVDGFAHPEKRPLLSELRMELVHFLQVMKTSRTENQRAILPTTARKGK